jgi:hypothetical protein
MPWLRGNTIAAADTLSPSTLDKLARWQSCDGPCTDYGGMELVADIASTPGNETILASFSTGIVVLDSSGALLSRGAAFDPAGSADELVALAVGDAWLEMPVIAIVVRVGGRREHQTWLELHRVGAPKTLERVFSAVVEEHEDQTDSVGTVTFVRNGLLYRAPRSASAELWLFDSRAGRYVARGANNATRSAR